MAGNEAGVEADGPDVTLIWGFYPPELRERTMCLCLHMAAFLLDYNLIFYFLNIHFIVVKKTHKIYHLNYF